MSKRVLLIEDEPHISEAISFILEREGYAVRTHANGADAVQKVHDETPDVVILDVMLPNRSGFDILREIRSGDQTRQLPVLMLTAKGQAKDRELAESYGVSRFMLKPFSNREVLDAVKDMVT